MFGGIFSAIGGLLGKSLGGGILSTIGRFAGRTLWKYLEQKTHEVDETQHFQNIKDSFAFSQARYGEAIALVFGTIKVSGKIIWATKVKEVANTTTEKKYFPIFDNVRSIEHNIEYDYYLTFAVAICEGEISQLMRVWSNGELIDLSLYNYRLYLGSEEQQPDPLIVNLEGKAPAFRDLAYILFIDLPLSDFNNSVPNFSFEILRKANIQMDVSVEDIVKSIVMIPGSGEYVYDTRIQYKVITDEFHNNINKRTINSHNYQNIADSVYSLNQLQIVCPNVEWIAVVICWFGDSTDISKCSIRPAIEFNDKYIRYSEEWVVGNYTRSSAYIISKDLDGNPVYGGTVNDASLLRYLEELRQRKLKIMFYPMVFLDVNKKPWRGHMTGQADDVREFFSKDEGYNNFILHYARLVKNHTDAFVIGSELIGLTKILNSKNEFVAVNELCLLAERVKKTIGSSVLVTYAADWSEYHHTENGWYNLDPLWASPYIDFIGIDAYFPVTNTTSSQISFEDILKGWKSGEGYEYFVDKQNRTSLSPPYAWKNLQYWWENEHINPDNIKTRWRSRMKKIWFTEFGFPSIDKATNQPNVFFDPNCVDGGVPKHSSGEIDFTIQRKAIRAFIEYWSSQEYIEQMFLWTWDARPYPAWPHMNVWRDGNLWAKGHWVNNKFGAASVAAIILELSKRSNIELEKINVTSLDESVEGIIFNKDISVIDAINTLRIAYFFDILANSGEEICFVKRGNRVAYQISSDMLMKLENNSYFQEQHIAEGDLLSKIELFFIECSSKDYRTSYCFLNSENEHNTSVAKFHLPIILSFSEAETLCRLILKNARSENLIVSFILPITYLGCKPSDFISFSYAGLNYQLRIINIDIDSLSLKIHVTAIIDDTTSYYEPIEYKQQNFIYDEETENKLLVLDLPAIFDNMIDENYVAVFYYGKKDAWLCASITQNYTKIANLKPNGDIGSCSSKLSMDANIFLIDEISSVIVHHSNFFRYVTNDWNLALFGDEIIKFKKWHLVGKNTYKLSSLIRGCFATEDKLNFHQNGEKFLLLNSYALLLPIAPILEYSDISFKLHYPNSSIQKIIFQNKSAKLPHPFIDSIRFDPGNKLLNIEWRMRSNNDSWCNMEFDTARYYFEIIIFQNNTSYSFTANEENFTLNLSEYNINNLDDEIDIKITAYDRISRKISLASTKRYSWN